MSLRNERLGVAVDGPLEEAAPTCIKSMASNLLCCSGIPCDGIH